MSKWKRAWHYWCQSIQSAKGKFGAMMLSVSIIAWLVFIVTWLADYPRVLDLSPANAKLISAVIGIGSTLYCLLWLPFKRHEVQQKLHDAEKLALENKIGALEKSQQPKRTKEEEEQLQRNRDSLASYLDLLNRKRVAINQMGASAYEKTLKDGIDEELRDCINSAAVAIEMAFDAVEGASFRSHAGFPKIASNWHLPQTVSDIEQREIRLKELMQRLD